MKSRKIYKKGVLAALSASLLFATPISIYADQDVEVDSAGNVFSSEAPVEGGVHFAGFSAGQNVAYSNVEIEDTLALAGMNIKLEDSTVGSSVFAAGYDVDIEDSDISGNIVSAGYSINIDEDTVSNAVIATGANVTFSGETDALHIAAETVIINGIVNGDADISANNLVISEDAIIEGTLSVKAENEPELGDASIGTFEFEKVESDSDVAPIKKTIGLIILGKIKSVIYWTIAMSLVALLMCLLIPQKLTKAEEMVRVKTAPMLVSGGITLVAFPLAAIIVSVSFVGLPIALISTVIYSLLLGLSVTFAGASLGRLVFKKMDPILASVCSVAILEVVKEIPILGTLVFIAAAVYTIGFFIQNLWEGRLQKDRVQKDRVQMDRSQNCRPQEVSINNASINNEGLQNDIIHTDSVEE